MLGHSPLGTQALGALENQTPGLSITLGATEARDGFAGTLNAGLMVTLGATEARDTFSGSAQVIATTVLAGTEARDTLSATLAVTSTLTLGATEARDTFSGALGPIATVNLGATEARDTFAGSMSASTSIALGGVESRDTVAFSLSATTPATLSGVEASDTFAGSLTTVTEEPVALGPGGWGAPRKVREHLRVDDRAELRALILKAKRGETAEAEAVVEAVADFVETTQDDVVQIDWTALEHAQEQLAVVLQAVVAFQRHQQMMAADMAARAEALARFEQEEDDLIALMLAV